MQQINWVVAMLVLQKHYSQYLIVSFFHMSVCADKLADMRELVVAEGTVLGSRTADVWPLLC